MRSSLGTWEVRFLEDKGGASSREGGRKEEKEGAMQGERHACRQAGGQADI